MLLYSIVINFLLASSLTRLSWWLNHLLCNLFFSPVQKSYLRFVRKITGQSSNLPHQNKKGKKERRCVEVDTRRRRFFCDGTEDLDSIKIVFSLSSCTVFPSISRLVRETSCENNMEVFLYVLPNLLLVPSMFFHSK